MCLLSSFGWGFEICLFMLGWLLGCAYVCIMNQANAGITSWHLRRCRCSVLQQSFIHINVVFSVMPKPSLLSRRTASDALRYHVADIHEDSPHIVELIIRIRSDIGALPRAKTIIEECINLATSVSTAYAPLLKFYTHLTALGREDWTALTWATYAAAVLGTRSSIVLPRLAESVPDWGKAALEGRSVIMGELAPRLERGALWIWTIAWLALGSACVVLAHKDDLVESDRTRLYLSWMAIAFETLSIWVGIKRYQELLSISSPNRKATILCGRC